jgi:hypothetical protein
MRNSNQAIETKYLGPTNTKGSRVKAKSPAGSVTISWDYGLNTRDNHRAAAEALAAKFELSYEQLATKELDKSYAHTLVI